MTEPATFLYRLGRGMFRGLFYGLCRLEVEGKEHLPESGGVILAPNHISHLDPPLVGSAVGRPVYFMAKRELFEVPVLGWLIRRTHAFPVNRETADRRAIKRAQELLAAGGVLVVFPEGTRSEDGRLQEAELGLAMIAARAKVPVVPVGLVGSNRALPRGSMIFRPAKIHVRLGPALRLEEADAAEAGGARARLGAFTDKVMAGIRALLPEEMGGNGAPAARDKQAS